MTRWGNLTELSVLVIVEGGEGGVEAAARDPSRE
jgi:hypothetical protein